MSRKKNNKQDIIDYNYIKHIWRERCLAMALSAIKWRNTEIPISKNVIEDLLVRKGMCCAFRDSYGKLLYMECTGSDGLNGWGEPSKYTAFSQNGGMWHDLVDGENCVIIRNNPLCTGEYDKINYFASMMADTVISWIVNIKTTRTTTGIVTPESQKLSVENSIADAEIGRPFILLTKDYKQVEYKTLNTSTEFIANRLTAELNSLWGEWLTYLGVPSISRTNGANILKDEAAANMTGAIACRSPRTVCREIAVEKMREILKSDIYFEYDIDGVDMQNILFGSDSNLEGVQQTENKNIRNETVNVSHKHLWL